MPPRSLFADAFYWVALLNPGDAFHIRLGLTAGPMEALDYENTFDLCGVVGQRLLWQNRLTEQAGNQSAVSGQNFGFLGQSEDRASLHICASF